GSCVLNGRSCTRRGFISSKSSDKIKQNLVYRESCTLVLCLITKTNRIALRRGREQVGRCFSHLVRKKSSETEALRTRFFELEVHLTITRISARNTIQMRF
ncbi:unnamed protein product, partial [Amoebophrya sp. A120]